MKNIGLVSIIIPVFNAEEYLDDCITSILKQSYKNLEIICVNDGSIDNSLNLLEKLKQTDNRIIVINETNQGVTFARKNGVLQSKGDWICFSDADDLMPNNAIEKLTDSVDNNIDMVIGNVEFQGSFKWPYKPYCREYTPRQYIKKIITKKIHCGPIAKLFARKLFTADTFDINRNIVSGEDYIMNLKIANNVNSKVKQITDIVYYYIQRPSFHPMIFSNRINRLRIEINVLRKKYICLCLLQFFIFLADETKNCISMVVRKK